MPKPLIVDIPHDLGRDEAKRRLEQGTEQARAFLAKSGVAVDQLAWTGDLLGHGGDAEIEPVAGTIDVGAESVRLKLSMRCTGLTRDISSVSRMGRIKAKSWAMVDELSSVAFDRHRTSPCASSFTRSSNQVTLQGNASISASRLGHIIVGLGYTCSAVRM